MEFILSHGKRNSKEVNDIYSRSDDDGCYGQNKGGWGFWGGEVVTLNSIFQEGLTE